MSSVASSGFTEAEYLALERVSKTKHEFVAGAIVAMAGARPPHNVLTANATAALVALAKERGCITMSSDQRVHVPSTGLYAYPDVTVGCGERRYDGNEPPSLLNPTLVVEVTSDSTEDYDRGTKFLHYQAIVSLAEYVIVSHRERRIDHFRRLDDGQWLATTRTGDGSIELLVLAGSLALTDVYAGVVFDEGRSDGK
ncbi:MAG TPA: Uma2 family endonuclease [Polyangiaceae bacterium]